MNSQEFIIRNRWSSHSPMFDCRMNGSLTTICFWRDFIAQYGINNQNDPNQLHIIQQGTNTQKEKPQLIGNRSKLVRHEKSDGTKKGPYISPNYPDLTKNRNSPANICPRPIAVARNSLYVLLEIRMIHILDETEPMFLLKCNTSDKHTKSEWE